jgi:hypothetical protein
METYRINVNQKIEKLKSKLIYDTEKTNQKKKLMEENQQLRVKDLLYKLVNKADRGKSNKVLWI